jgi:hypothetical protein
LDLTFHLSLGTLVSALPQSLECVQPCEVLVLAVLGDVVLNVCILEVANIDLLIKVFFLFAITCENNILVMLFQLLLLFIHELLRVTDFLGTIR